MTKVLTGSTGSSAPSPTNPFGGMVKAQSNEAASWSSGSSARTTGTLP
jgi:hypothetical protein